MKLGEITKEKEEAENQLMEKDGTLGISGRTGRADCSRQVRLEEIMHFTYCPHCGEKLVQKEIGDEERCLIVKTARSRCGTPLLPVSSALW